MAEHAESDPSLGQAARIVDAVARAQDAQRRLLARGRASLGVGATDAAVLRYLGRARMSRVTLTELATWLDVTPAAASMASKRLVGAGYLERVDDDSDHRRRHVALTASGRSAVEAAFGEADREATALVELLDDAVVDTVVETLDAIAAVFDDPASAERRR